MKSTRVLPKKCLVLLIALPLSGCYGLHGHDEMDRYFQRSESITMSAGDAKQVNAVAHTIHPWPSYVGDRRLAYDARRAGSAVQRYGNSQRPRDQLPNIEQTGRAMGPPPPSEQSINVQGLGAGTTSGVAVPVGSTAGNN
jgi:hypothetical protein